MKAAWRRIALGTALPLVAWLVFIADPTDESDIAEPVATRDRREQRHASPRTEPIEILELRTRPAPSNRTTSLFSVTTWTPPPQPVAAMPAPPQPAPPPPFTYVGKDFDGTRWQVFVNHGADTLILRENQVVNGYRIESIVPPQMSVLYLPTNERHTLAIGPGE